MTPVYLDVIVCNCKTNHPHPVEARVRPTNQHFHTRTQEQTAVSRQWVGSSCRRHPPATSSHSTIMSASASAFPTFDGRVFFTPVGHWIVCVGATCEICASERQLMGLQSADKIELYRTLLNTERALVRQLKAKVASQALRVTTAGDLIMMKAHAQLLRHSAKDCKTDWEAELVLRVVAWMDTFVRQRGVM